MTASSHNLSPRARALAVALLAIPFWGVATAQTATLRFAGGTHPDVPLLGSTDFILLPDGNYEGRCVLAAGTTRCQGVTAGGSTGGPPPAVTLTAPAAATTGSAIAVTRGVTNAPQLCVASATPSAGVSGWSGAVGPGGGTSQVTFTSAGTYTLSLKCYNAFGASSTASATVQATGGGTGPGACPLAPHPNIRPSGFTEYLRTWEQTFFGLSYPNRPSWLTPVGSWNISRPSFNGPPSAGMYISIPFVPAAGDIITLRMSPAQSIATPDGTSPGRPGNFFITVSPCAGDLRSPAGVGQGDTWQQNCRVFGTELNFTFGARSDMLCRLTAGQTYYLTFSATDAYNPSPTSSTCFGGSARCEVNVR